MTLREQRSRPAAWRRVTDTVAAFTTIAGATLLGILPHAAAGPPPPELRAWVGEAEAAVAAVNQAYASGAARDARRRLVTTLLARDALLAELVAGDGVPASPPGSLTGGDYPGEVVSIVSAVAAERLLAARLYEEALAWLRHVDASHLPLPRDADYLRAVASHQLVRLDQAAEHANRIVSEEGDLPRRYRAVAELILRDVAAADPEAAQHLARPMSDIRRRLALGRSGEPAQRLQREVLQRLDELIEEAETQRRQQSRRFASRPQQAPAQPMQDSLPAEMKAPGRVDRRRFAAGDAWGSLPPRERQRVTQQITRDFPAYYREMIEAYFRSLAEGDAKRDQGPPSPPASNDPGSQAPPQPEGAL